MLLEKALKIKNNNMNPIFENRVKFLKNKLTEGKDLTEREAWELLNIEVRNNNYNLKNKNHQK